MESNFVKTVRLELDCDDLRCFGFYTEKLGHFLVHVTRRFRDKVGSGIVN